MPPSRRALLSCRLFRAQPPADNRSRFLARATKARLAALLAQQPAVSAAHTGLAVLGRQHRARALCGRSCPAADIVLRPLDRDLPDAVAVRASASAPGLAHPARALAADPAVLADRLCRQQRAVLL